MLASFSPPHPASPFFTSPRKGEVDAKRRVGVDRLRLLSTLTPTLPLFKGGRYALAGLFLLLYPGISTACDIIPLSPESSWEELINRADTVFVGQVQVIQPNPKPGWEDRVFLSIDIPIKGTLGSRYEAMQGSGGDCGLKFSVGDRVVFAGDSILAPTVLLTSPPTRTQALQLSYLNKLAQEQAVEGAGR